MYDFTLYLVVLALTTLMRFDYVDKRCVVRQLTLSLGSSAAPEQQSPSFTEQQDNQKNPPEPGLWGFTRRNLKPSQQRQVFKY